MGAMNLQPEFPQKKPTRSGGLQSPLSPGECLRRLLSFHLRVFFCLCGVGHFNTPCRAPQRPSHTTATIHRVFKICFPDWLKCSTINHHSILSVCLHETATLTFVLQLVAAIARFVCSLSCTATALDGCCAVIANVLESPLLISDDKTDSVSWTVLIQQALRVPLLNHSTYLLRE